MKGRPATLLRLVAGRILLFGGAAMLIQIGVVLAEYWADDEGLARQLIEIESEKVAAGLIHEGSRISFELTPTLRRRYLSDYPEAADDDDESDTISPGYYARVRTRSGVVLYSNCGEECTEHFLPLSVNPPSFWVRVIQPGKPLTFSGGRTVLLGDEAIHLELAVVGDPESLVFSVLGHEMVDHMVVPMVLMLVLVIGATIWSLRVALEPVSKAAADADAIDPRDPRAKLTTEGMPREIANLATAVNRALERIGELVRSQRLFVSAIAHEIRTPVAAVRLELERIDHPRALKAIGDIDGLTHVLEQLTSLARLEAVDKDGFEVLDLALIGEDVATAMAPFVYASGRSIGLSDLGGERVRGVPSLVENLVRNLVENAVKHTPVGTTITIEAGPGRRITVCDDGPGFAPQPQAVVEQGTLKAAGGVGIGLRIVDRIAMLHGGRVVLDPAEPHGSRVGIEFPDPSSF